MALVPEEIPTTSSDEATKEFFGYLVEVDCGEDGYYTGCVTQVETADNDSCTWGKIKLEKPLRNGVPLDEQLAIIVPGQLINNIKVLNMPSQESPTQTQSSFSFTSSKQSPQITPEISQQISIHHQHRFPIQSQQQPQRFSSFQQQPPPKFSSQKPNIFHLQQPPPQSRISFQQTKVPRVLFSPQQQTRIHHVQQQQPRLPIQQQHQQSPRLPFQYHHQNFSPYSSFCQFPCLSRNPIIRTNSILQGRQKIFRNRTQNIQINNEQINNNKIQNLIPRIVEINNNNNKLEKIVSKTTVQQNIKKIEKIVPKVNNEQNKRMEISSTKEVIKNDEKIKDGHDKIAEQIDKNTEIISKLKIGIKQKIDEENKKEEKQKLEEKQKIKIQRKKIGDQFKKKIRDQINKNEQDNDVGEKKKNIKKEMEEVKDEGQKNIRKEEVEDKGHENVKKEEEGNNNNKKINNKDKDINTNDNKNNEEEEQQQNLNNKKEEKNVPNIGDRASIKSSKGVYQGIVNNIINDEEDDQIIRLEKPMLNGLPLISTPFIDLPRSIMKGVKFYRPDDRNNNGHHHHNRQLSHRELRRPRISEGIYMQSLPVSSVQRKQNQNSERRSSDSPKIINKVDSELETRSPTQLAHEEYGEYKKFTEPQIPIPIRLQHNSTPKRHSHNNSGPTGIPTIDCINGYRGYGDKNNFVDTMGDALDYETLNTDFDFDANLALFDKAAFTNQKDRVTFGLKHTGTNSRNYNHDENILLDSSRVISWTKNNFSPSSSNAAKESSIGGSGGGKSCPHQR